MPVYFYLFDLIWFDGYDLAALPLVARKSVLRRDHVRRPDPLFAAPRRGRRSRSAPLARRGGGAHRQARRGALHHARSNDWLKFKCVNEQEFVVVGWTEPHGSRSGLGALLVGYHEDGELQFGGKVGTGFGERELSMLTGVSARSNRRLRRSPKRKD